MPFNRMLAGVMFGGCVIAFTACEDKPASPAPAEAPKPSAAAASAAPKVEAPPPASVGVKIAPREGALEVDRAASKLGWTDGDASEADDARFEKYEATVVLADGKPTSLSIRIEAASLTVKDKPDLAKRVKTSSLDAFNNARASFVSESVTPSTTPNEYTVEGKITFRMTTKPVTFPVTVETAGTSYRMKGGLALHGANFGAEGKLGMPFELVFPFPD